MADPLVSVITITRNRGNLIGRCITSVLTQTYSNLEYVIVDGASTDNTDTVIKEFGYDKRLKFIKLSSNLSVIDSIAIAVDNSQGKYLTFLDSDDEYISTKVEKQVTLFETLPSDYGMVYCWMSYFENATGRILRVHKAELRGSVGDEVVEMPVISGTPTYMMRMVAYLQSGGWNKDIGIISDWEFAARFCQSWKVDYVPESLVNVYINHGSVRQSDGNYYSDFLQKNIIFHNYFLVEFKRIFDKFPEKKHFHLRSLAIHHIKLKEYKQAWKRYSELMQCSFSVYNLFYFPLFFLKSLFETKREY